MSKSFEEKRSSVKLKHLLTLKTSNSPSATALKIGCSMVVLFFEKLEKPIDSQEIFELNQGLNKELFCFYFAEPVKMMSEIQKSNELVLNKSIPQSNIRFVRLVLEDINSDSFLKGGPVFVALRIIYDFIISFIEYYEEVNGCVESNNEKIFSFSQISSNIGTAQTLKKSLWTLNEMEDLNNFKQKNEDQIEIINEESQDNDSIMIVEMSQEIPE